MFDKEKEYYVGDIIKGHTYFIGDFHDVLKGKVKKSHLGMPKLRKGIVLIRRHPFYKVQFQNSSAIGYEKRNTIIYRVKGEEQYKSIVGRDSYCLWVHYSKIKEFETHSEIIDFENILKVVARKHSKGKKLVEKAAINNELIKFELSKQRYFLQQKQFTEFEKKYSMNTERACMKIRLLNDRLRNRHLTLKNRIKIHKRILEASDWIQDQQQVSEDITKIVKRVHMNLEKMEESKDEY